MEYQQNTVHNSRASELSAAETDAVTSFLGIVNDVIRGNESANPMSENTALKFLIARKFDVKRAVQLYQIHEITRLREGLMDINPNDEDLRVELESRKFTILKQRDSNNSSIAVFTAKLHAPNKSSTKEKIHRTTLQGVVYQLDSALEDITTQRNGIVFVYNMSDSDYSNFDLELCQKILNLLKGAYPAKLKKVLIVSPPLWFRAPFLVLRVIVREKLRDRVWLLNMSQLPEHIPPHALITDLGGQYQHDHRAWIDECDILHNKSYNDLCDPTSAEALVKSFRQKSIFNFRKSSDGIPVGTDATSLDICETYGDSAFNIGRRGSKSATYDYDDTGVSLAQFVEIIRTYGKEGLGAEYDSIPSYESKHSFSAFAKPANMRKNRYVNIKCFDHTRVVLEPHDIHEIHADDSMDYINANFVDGYRQPKAYISTQGPIPITIIDFWRMMWQTGSRVIVMVTLNVEGGVLKCDRYWPASGDPIVAVGVYTIEYVNHEDHEDFAVTQIKLTDTRSGAGRDVWHFQFTSWPDFGTPLDAGAFFKYREYVLKKQLDAIEEEGGSSYPPIVVHCSAGVGRSGTFITIDICIQKLETTGLVDVKGVVEKLRNQRFLSIQTKDQYVFCYKSVLEYAASCGLLEGLDATSDALRQD